MLIDLPFPAAPLWPNKRAHWAAKAREAKKHRVWACMATKATNAKLDAVKRIRITVYPKARGPAPDRDNCIAAFKAYQDGIADGLGFNDATFPAPEVRISETRRASFVVEVV